MSQHDVNLGSILTSAAGRDAIHIAIAPVKAAERLSPGDHIGLVTKGVASSNATKLIGIVDPYLTKWVEKDQMFYMCLYPRTIKSLRHEWTHEDFENARLTAIEESQEYIKKFANRIGWGYDDVIEQLAESFDSGNGYGGDDNTAEMFNNDKHNLLTHYATITGKTLTIDKVDEVYFRCAC